MATSFKQVIAYKKWSRRIMEIMKIPSTKFQANDKFQAPNYKQMTNSKHQITNKWQIPSTKMQTNDKFQAPNYKQMTNSKYQIANFKQISMTEIQNSKQLRMTAGYPISVWK